MNVHTVQCRQDHKNVQQAKWATSKLMISGFHTGGGGGCNLGCGYWSGRKYNHALGIGNGTCAFSTCLGSNLP